jgi:DNA polymerase
MRACTRCEELASTRQQVVVGSGPVDARLVVVGEAPGAQEDETGVPFVGRSGQLLDRLLAEAGMPRDQVAVINTVKCRPPNNRVPSKAETANCRPWTQQQLGEMAPRLVVPVGLSATSWFLGKTTLGAVRGRVHEVDGLRVLPTFHPAAALRGGPNGVAMTTLREDLQLAVRLAS